MGILDVTGLKFKYRDIDLYKSQEFHLELGEHICLVGDNGSGKSTFMKLISKNLIPDSGTILWQNHISYSYLDQHLEVDSDINTLDYLTGVFSNLFKKEIEIHKLYDSLGTADPNDYEKIMKRANIFEEELEKENFYQLSSTISNVTNGLGISDYMLERPLRTLSGGERAKVFLGKMILENKDVLLLDEPTNFLDKDHVDWLSRYLKSFTGSFICVSHDEGFIRDIATVIYSLNNGIFTKYRMNYDMYLKEREIREAHYEKQYINQQKKIKEIETFIEKNIVRASTTKQAQSRRKMLERMEKLEKPKNHRPMKLLFPYSKQTGDIVLKLDDLSIGYNDKAILEHLNLKLMKNQKIAIIGRNGIGKSTLVKTITGQIPVISGSFTWNNSVDLNIFAQEEHDLLDVTPINYLRYFYHLKTDQELREVLAKVSIGPDLCTKKMKELSGGEQTKVRLALMSMKKANVLILDEPTNHLDPITKMELFDALNAFPGVLILISHEKDFYDELIDEEIYL